MFPTLPTFLRISQVVRNLTQPRSTVMGGFNATGTAPKTVVVLGMAYGGARAAQVLAAGLPDDWRIIGIDRNSHLNHMYVMPRFAVLPGHEHKAFIPYTNVFLEDESKPNHVAIKADVTALRPNSVTISRPFPELGIPSREIPFDYAVYALGGTMPAPLDPWGKDPRDDDALGASGTRMERPYDGTKMNSINWLQERQKVVKASSNILIVGGGALGIQFATDIKALYPEKHVTLLHSRSQLLPRYDPGMHDEIRKAMSEQGIELILNQRLDLSSLNTGAIQAGKKVVSTQAGRQVAADLVLMCTGQTPNTAILSAMEPSTINPSNGLAHVNRAMQVRSEAVSSNGLAKHTYENIFAIGDSADAFGATKSGRSSWFQGEIAAKNIVKLVNKADEALEEYVPEAPMIKVSLGFVSAASLRQMRRATD
ncbi:hypothetical protein NMY22_g5553 [Coprinellus aureogranulatus]|nr:hypothetical protein NMY22_g5553 [Coprinellus aureogranulatus]